MMKRLREKHSRLARILGPTAAKMLTTSAKTLTTSAKMLTASAKMLKALAITLCATAMTLSAAAQTDYGQRQLTMDEGLPSNDVSLIVQDQRGFIWMATEGGLCRYDGRTVKTFALPEEGSQAVRAVVTGGKDRLFVGTPDGVYAFSLSSERFSALDLGLKKPVSSLSMDLDERLWIGTEGQGIVSYKRGEEPRNYLLADGGGAVSQVLADGDNQVWALCQQGGASLWHLNKRTDTFEPARLQAPEAAPSDPTCMLQTADGRRWVATWEHGLWLLGDDGRMEPMPAPATGHILHAHSLSAWGQEQLLVASDDGLWLFDTARRQFELYRPQRFAHSALRDNEGGLWVGFHYGGVTYVSPISQRFSAVPGGLVARFAEDRHGRLWVAGSEGGVSCYSGGRKRLNDYKGSQQLQHLNAHALCAEGEQLWIGTYSDGVYVLNMLTGKTTHHKADDADGGLYDDNIHTIFSDSRHQIWVATGQGLCRYDQQEARFVRVLPLPAAVIDIDEDRQGRLWLATLGNGITRLDPDGRTRHYRNEARQEASLWNDVVNCVLIDAEDRLWAGTQSGLCRYDEAKDNFTRVALNVPRQAVAAIAEDEGVLWLAGDCGILRYDKQRALQRFTRQDGLLSDQFQPSAVLKASDGCIYFGTVRGFNSFYPYQIRVNQQLPPVYITQLEIGTEPIDVGNWRLERSLTDADHLDLWMNDRMVSLSFASLSYCSPEKNLYAYMLEGFDKQWNYVGSERKATYTNLPAGTYTFRVKATNNDGIWSDSEAKLKIVVHPPYWWSTYAKVAYVVMAIGLIWAFIWLRLKLSERRHKKEMQQLREQKQEELQRARMDFFTTIAHEIRTPVSLIIGPLEQLKKAALAPPSSPEGDTMEPSLNGKSKEALDLIDRNAHRLLDLVNQLLDFRKAEEQKEVRFQATNLTDLLRQVAADFAPAFTAEGHTFSCQLPQERIIAAIDPEGVRKVVSNLLSNAKKYTHDHITLRLSRTADGERVAIEVADNGQGIAAEDQQRLFDPFFQTARSKPGTGIGLSIVRRIVEQHGGTVSVDSVPEEGTTFTVVLPLRQAVVAESAATTGSNSPQAPQPEAATPATAAPATGPSADAQPPTTPEAKPAMLIVDDNEDMLTFLVTTFMDDYDVTPARNGVEALDLIGQSLVVKDGGEPTSAYDIVISDWMMDGMEGPDLCNRLRQNPATRRLPFILLTAKTDSQSKVEAMNKGVDAFIEKPFAVKYLEACIRNLMKRREG